MYKSCHQERVEEMMEKMGQTVRHTPTIPPEDERKLRANLILEETIETINALGFNIVVGNDPLYSTLVCKENVRTQRNGERVDITEVADGCADLSVVTVGTLSCFGIEDSELLLIVDENNMDKFGPGSYRREDGKWIKPPDFVGPDLSYLTDTVYLYYLPELDETAEEATPITIRGTTNDDHFDRHTQIYEAVTSEIDEDVGEVLVAIIPPNGEEYRVRFYQRLCYSYDMPE